MLPLNLFLAADLTPRSKKPARDVRVGGPVENPVSVF
jgi:hypothetical protein